MKPKVVFSNVSKKYSLYKKKSDKLFQLLFNKGNDVSFYALNNISFNVFEGETIGVIGTNGSGKSTLSNLLARVVPPTEGTITINGETSLIAINVGLNNNITGLENIELKCLMHGLDKKTIKELTPKIIEFADIGDFIDQPVKSYSSGMKSRLGFAISVHTEPDILVVDEALSVGDQTFYEKCLSKINEFKSEGKTIFFISHSISQIKSISDRVLWLSFGEIEEFGEPESVIGKYNEYIKWFNALSDQDKKKFKIEKLQSQKRLKTTSSDISRGNREKKRKNFKKPNNSFKFQIISLVFLTLLLGVIMFIDESINITSWFNKIKQETTVESEPTLKKLPVEQVKEVIVNKQAIINVDGAKVFSDIEQENFIMDLPFSTEVLVNKDYEDVYEIAFMNKKYFLSKSSIELISLESLNNGEISLRDLEPVLPENLNSSYLYFFAQLNQEIGDVKSTLNGLTGESSNYGDVKVLEYSYDNVSIMFNSNGIADTIFIGNINVDSFKLNLIEMFQHTADGQSLFYSKSDKYIYIVDILNKTLTIKVKNT